MKSQIGGFFINTNENGIDGPRGKTLSGFCAKYVKGNNLSLH